MLAKGADVDARTDTGQTPLMNAAYGCKEAVVRILLEGGANINAQDLKDLRRFIMLLGLEMIVARKRCSGCY